jgi:hypothetical protein
LFTRPADDARFAGRTTPAGGSIERVATLELNALWLAACRMLRELADDAGAGEAEAIADALADRLEQGIREGLWNERTGMYDAALVRTGSNEWERCGLAWPALQTDTALMLNLLPVDRAPWDGTQRMLMVGHLLARGAGDDPLTGAALAVADTPQRAILLERADQRRRQDRSAVHLQEVYGEVPRLERDGRQGPYILHLALLAYAVCRENIDTSP